MLCIPKGLLEYIIACKYPYNTIFYCKKIFPGSKEAANYFENMCKEDFEMLADYMSDNKHDKKRTIIQLLSKMYGYKNWKGYISHINKFTQENLEDYVAYMQTVEEISSLVNASFDWKLSGRALNKAYVSAIRQRNDLMNKEAKKEKELFRDKCKNWRSLEYKNDKFLVIAPKEPSDLITEGLRLKHCAKEYITPVTYGKTTIMFIRKKEEPDKPFFTVEIRDNAIRQCHGICNKNACAEAGVRDFLTEYSEAKNLSIGDIDKWLGPEDEEIVPDEETQHNEELLDARFNDEGLFD